jgi:hypothetical protein
MRAVSIENGSGGSSPGCISTADQSIVAPSSRGGVPVLRRPSAKPSRSSVSRQSDGGGLADPAGRRLLFAHVNQPAQERAGRQDDGAAGDFAAVLQPDTGDPVGGNQQIVRLAFDHGQVRGLPDRPLHRFCVEFSVGLRARSAHRRPLAAVENAELDAALVYDPAHQAIERIDLAHQMTFAEPADRRVAGHRTDGREPVRDKRRARAHTRSRSRSLAAGVAAANHNDIEGSHGFHPQGL